MKKRKLFIVSMLLLVLISSCKQHPSFKSSEEALAACNSELKSLRSKQDCSIEDLAKITKTWLEIQDSSFAAFSRDSAATLHSRVALAYFTMADSMRYEIARLAFSKDRSLKDVMYLNLNTAKEEEKVKKSDTWKDAVTFYNNLDEVPLYSDIDQTTKAYYQVLFGAKEFKTENQLKEYIADEDRCFRSLMRYLNAMPQGRLQDLTDKTAKVFDNIYSNIGYKNNGGNKRAMLYLTMRFNRRIIQNALACQSDIENNIKLNNAQKANYRWMLIQPFLALDSYSVATLTNDQKKALLDLSSKLPDLLARTDEDQSSKEAQAKMIGILSNYFLKSFINSSL